MELLRERNTQEKSGSYRADTRERYGRYTGYTRDIHGRHTGETPEIHRRKPSDITAMPMGLSVGLIFLGGAFIIQYQTAVRCARWFAQTEIKEPHHEKNCIPKSPPYQDTGNTLETLLCTTLHLRLE